MVALLFLRNTLSCRSPLARPHTITCVSSNDAALPFLSNTQVFLWYPIIAVVLWLLLSVVLLVLGMKINPTRMLMAFHYG